MCITKLRSTWAELRKAKWEFVLNKQREICKVIMSKSPTNPRELRATHPVPLSYPNQAASQQATLSSWWRDTCPATWHSPWFLALECFWILVGLGVGDWMRSISPSLRLQLVRVRTSDIFRKQSRDFFYFFITQLQANNTFIPLSKK